MYICIYIYIYTTYINIYIYIYPDEGSPGRGPKRVSCSLERLAEYGWKPHRDSLARTIIVYYYSIR